ncbi:uncharacterized membrane protein (DUF4010 family) [Inquilinus ginsengisoli]|uniref:Uncharacterized membrane protein (DUF4010 family) n=1 Tax=Inquilinus ginsengisoli TaxID=363840 RepID=A0ABU1JJL3_9PROT|nr:DUF4010 domain-containing protein [Inquilinus ginsengisoli]MDR6287764.1 uncharacterized membrane protein (DUF4010 family) [Inquilinus ginsengisoli]
MDETLPALRLGAALAVGLIIGLERGWTDRGRPEGRRAAGLRTFTIAGFGGGVAALLAPDLGPGPLLLFLLGIGAYMLAAYWRDRDGGLGLTTEVAMLVTVLLGAAAGAGHVLVGAGGSVVVALLLREKDRLHGWLDRFTPAETAAALQFLLIAVVVPPLLPDRTLDPWQAINPAKIWWLVVLVAGLSFAGYAAVRIAGARVGTLLTGLLGGLVSSTALTLVFARQAQAAPQAAPALAAGVMTAWAVMVLRIGVLVLVLHPPLFLALAAPLAGAAIVAAGSGLWLWRAAAHRTSEAPPLGNPLELWSALKIVALIVAVLVLSKALEATLGVAGLYLLGAVSGLADVDAITLSAARLAQGGLDVAVCANVVLIAAGVNTLVKAGLAVVLGGRAMALRIVPVTVAMLAAGVAGLTLSAF